MDSTAQDTGYDAGLDTSCGKPCDQGYIPPSLNAPGRKHPIHEPHESTAATFIGGILDSPLVQVSQRSAGMPLSPPLTQPTTQSLLPPVTLASKLSPLASEFSASTSCNEDRYGDGLGQLRSPSTYSPPLSPVGTSPSFASLALSLPPITLRHRNGSLTPAPSPPSSHHQTTSASPPDPSKILLSPLSPEWGAELVGDEGPHAPASIDAILSSGREGGRAHGGDELDDLGLGVEDGRSDAFAFAGFLNRSTRPRLSMLEIPPSVFPTTTLSPSSYYPSASSATPALWTVEQTPVSPLSSSLWKIEETRESVEARDQGEGCDEVTSPSVGDLPPATSVSALIASERNRFEEGPNHNVDTHDSSPPLSRLGSSSPSVRRLHLLDEYDENSFDAYPSPQLQYTALPSLLSSPHVKLLELPEEGNDLYGALHFESDGTIPTLIAESGTALLFSSGAVLGATHSEVEGDGVFTLKDDVANDEYANDEYANLSTLLGQLQADERDARAKEDEAMSAIASIRSRRIYPFPPSVHPLQDDSTLPPSPPAAVHPSPMSTNLSELQTVAADARRTAKKARARARELSSLLKLKARKPSSSASLLTSSPSPPMLFEPLDDTATSVSSIVSPPFPTLHMDFTISPPIFCSTSKALARNSRDGDVHHLVAKMILNRREAGSTPSHSTAAANSKPVFLSPLLGRHHQLQLQQRYKFLRSSPLARNVVTIASPDTLPASAPAPLISSSFLDSISGTEPGPLRSNSLDSTSSTDTACSLMGEWDSDGETSLGDEDELPDLDDEDAEMGFQALKTPLMWGLDLGFDDAQGVLGDGGGEGLLPLL